MPEEVGELLARMTEPPLPGTLDPRCVLIVDALARAPASSVRDLAAATGLQGDTIQMLLDDHQVGTALLAAG